MGNLADKIRKKTEEGKKRNQKTNDEFKKHEEELFEKLCDEYAKEADQLLPKAIVFVETSASQGKNNVEFLVGTCDSPDKETEKRLSGIALNLAMLFRKKGFKTQAICNISEEYVDSPRRIYAAVEIIW